MSEKQQQEPCSPKDEISLPNGIEVNEGTIKRLVRYPKKLYGEYYKICQKIGQSMAKVTVELIREFVNKNRHVI